MSNYLGPVAHSLYTDHNMAVTLAQEPGPGTIVFHSLRMPIPPSFLALSYGLFGDNLRAIYALKAFLFLIPLGLAMTLAYRRAQRQWLAVGLLVVPFLVPNFLLQIASMQIEEGFYYGFLVLAVALLLFVEPPLTTTWSLGMAAMLACLYLSKSSLRFACVAILCLACVRLKSWMPRLLLISVFALSMISWGAYQKAVSGKFTLGSSLDGLNLHKGNNETFLAHYPPSDNGYIDQWDATLSPNYPLSDEWDYDAYHLRAGETFIEAHPGVTIRADLTKLATYWISLRDIGSGHSKDVFTRLDPINMLLMRAVLLSALGLAIYCAIAVPSIRFAAIASLVVFATVCLPYVAGFALTRHATVLLYPAALFLTRALTVGVGAAGENRTHIIPVTVRPFRRRLRYGSRLLVRPAGFEPAVGEILRLTKKSGPC